MAKGKKRKVPSLKVSKKDTAKANRVTFNGARPPYICVHGPYGGCIKKMYNPDLDMYGPDGVQVDCSTCQYF
jgi:hypothetical protein